MQRDINIDLLLIVCYLVRQLKKIQTFIFITTNGLNNAKNILINGKLYQVIGVIFILRLTVGKK